MDPDDTGASRHEEAQRPASVALQGVREPVVVILLLAGFFDGISGNPLHAVILGTVAVALAFDPDRDAAMSRPAGGATAWRSRGWTVVATTAAFVCASAAGTFGRYSWPATLAIVVPGVTMLALAWRGPLPGTPALTRPDQRGAWVWAGAFVALALWELVALLMQPGLTTDSYAHPTISVLSDPVLASHPGRSVIMALWLCFGWFLVQR